MDALIYFGGEVKSLADGKFGGYLVRFSSADDPDLDGEWFTKDTDFGFTDTLKSPVYFNHRIPIKTAKGDSVVVKSQIGEAELTKDDTGILINAIIYTRKTYEKAIAKAGKANQLGWSSGTAKHLADVEENGEIKKWPLGLDASLTPKPCERRCEAIPAKSYESLKFEPIALDEIEDDPQAFDIKSVFADALAEYDRQTWELWSAVSRAAKDIYDAAMSSNVTGVSVDIDATVNTLVDDYAAELKPQIAQQIKDALDADIEDFYLKTVFDDMEDARAASRFVDHLHVVLAAAQEVQTRAKSINEMRVKSGRVLSDANRKRLTSLLTGLQSCAGDIDTLLKDTEPQPKSTDLVDPDVARGLVASFQLQTMRMNRAN